MKKKIIIANSHIPWGGLGQFSITLAETLKNLDYEIYGLVTHFDGQRFEEFVTHTNQTCYIGKNNILLRYFKSLKYIRKINPDYLIINYLATVHFLLPLIRKTKVISVIHSDQYDYYRIANINNRHVDQWIAPSPRIKEGFLEYNHSPDKIIRTKIIPHGVDHGPKKFRGVNNGIFKIAYVGSLYKHKGVDLLLEIFKNLLISCPNIHFTIIGGGELESNLVEECNKGEITENVTFKGVIPAKQVREELLNTDVLLFPSRLEAFGLVIVEAMMEGAVPVVTLLPGVTDFIINEGETGFLVKQNDVSSFTKRLNHLYNNRTLLLKMSTAAIIEARLRFSCERMSNEYDLMLNSL